MTFLSKAFGVLGWVKRLMGGDRNIMVGNVRVYLWPFTMMAVCLLLLWGFDTWWRS